VGVKWAVKKNNQILLFHCFVKDSNKQNDEYKFLKHIFSFVIDEREFLF